jgi:Glycosyltransferase family 87
MRRLVRENALCALLAAAGSTAMAWLGLYGFGWNDYEVEAKPAFDALTHGHLLAFLRLAPAYGGSLVERAPFALLPGLWGGGALAVYRMVAVPCLLAGAVLAVWLCARMRRAGSSRLARAVVLGVCVANPLTLEALELGHPEELLGACLCVAAVLLAGRGRPVWAGILLGLAIANKEWALIAAGPVLLALPPQTEPGHGRAPGRGHSSILLCAASAAAMSAVVLAPLALVPGGTFVASSGATAASQSAIFQPWQVWWFFGWHGALVHGLFGTPKVGYRTGPAWTATISHPLIVVVGLGLAGALWLQRRRSDRGPTGSPMRRPPVGERDALLLLALVLLLRCVLDTWNTGYYMLPFLLALLAWETLGPRRLPLLALAVVVLPWLGMQELSTHGMSPDGQAALYLAWTLPLAFAIGMAVYAPRRLSALANGRWRATAPAPEPARAADIVGGGAQETTVSALGRLVKTS